MTACGICGGFDYRHDPVAHGEGGDDDRCPSLYGPEQVQCVKSANEPHEWHTGSGVNPEDGEVYGAAWLSHWEPGLSDRADQ